MRSRVDEDDIGVVLERLGEEGAGDAGADDDHAVAAAPQHACPDRVLVTPREVPVHVIEETDRSRYMAAKTARD